MACNGQLSTLNGQLSPSATALAHGGDRPCSAPYAGDTYRGLAHRDVVWLAWRASSPGQTAVHAGPRSRYPRNRPKGSMV